MKGVVFAQEPVHYAQSTGIDSEIADS